MSLLGAGPLREELLRLARQVSPSTIQKVAHILERAESAAQAGARITALGSAAARSAGSALVTAWKQHQEISGASLALALEAAHAAYQDRSDSQILELAWTGPDTPQMPSRRTDQVLYQLIREAKERLLVVTFIAYDVEKVAEALRSASQRGVSVDLVLESRQESGGKISFEAIEALKPFPSGVSVYCWPLSKRQADPDGRYGTLHAKCAVADERAALVSSANLTGYALERNMELGVVIRGGEVPRRIARHFGELILRGILEPVG